MCGPPWYDEQNGHADVGQHREEHDDISTIISNNNNYYYHYYYYRGYNRVRRRFLFHRNFIGVQLFYSFVHLCNRFPVRASARMRACPPPALFLLYLLSKGAWPICERCQGALPKSNDAANDDKAAFAHWRMSYDIADGGSG